MRGKIMKIKPTAVTFFAGCGGSSLGYEQAGYQSLLEVEYDPDACATLRHNFKTTIIEDSDIRTLTGESVLRLTDLVPGELDLLHASPPCQGFSTAGKRDVNDERNALWQDYVRLLKVLRPKVTVMENVTGLTKGAMKETLRQIVEHIRSAGYRVDLRKMRMDSYGVPQKRPRLILIGIRDDLGIDPTFPPPSEKQTSLKDVCPHLKAYCSTQFDSEPQSAVNPAPTVMRNGAIKVLSKNGIWHALTLEESMKLSTFPDGFRFPIFKEPKEMSKEEYASAIQEMTVGFKFFKRFGAPESESENETFAEKIARITRKAFVGIFFPRLITKTAAKNQIGNCVPPEFAKRLGLHLWDTVFAKYCTREIPPHAARYVNEETWYITKKPLEYLGYDRQ